MSVSETFDRNFNKCMRGYNPEEVDSAVDALLRYCDDLESANREFEVANNDLIDEKTDLEKKLTELEKEKSELLGKISEMSENITKIEGVYNEYRTKFGEARELVGNAKKSAAEITERAGLKADTIIRDAERKSEKALAELEKEIAYRKKLIDDLSDCYSAFQAKLCTELGKMLDEVSNFSGKIDIPDVPDSLLAGAMNASLPPSVDDMIASHGNEEKNQAAKADKIFVEEPKIVSDAEAKTETDKKTEKADKPSEKAWETPQTSEINTKHEQNTATEIITPLGPVMTGGSGESKKASQFENIKASVERINSKVIEKKSTPHI